jgi:hypothetical protein
VLPDVDDPWLLARVRWPDVYQAISEAAPEWRSDPGLFDLPYDPGAVAITSEQAEAIAASWGAHLPADDEGAVPGPALIRRMPANWSELSPAVTQTWWIDARHRLRAVRETRRARRRGLRSAARAADAASVIMISDVEPDHVIDLTDAALAETAATEEAGA